METILELFSFYILHTHFFFSFLAAPLHMEFLSQESDLSRNCDLSHSHSYSNTVSLNPLFWARDRTCILVLQTHSRSCFTTGGTPLFSFFRWCEWSLTQTYARWSEVAPKLSRWVERRPLRGDKEAWILTHVFIWIFYPAMPHYSQF